MKNSKILKSILFITGLLLAGFGLVYLLTPVEFYGSANDTDIAGQVNLLSEIRASGGALLAGGLLAIFGAFKQKLTYTATLTSIIIWLGYGMSRILGIAVDGMPNEGIFGAMISEIAIGLLFVFVFIKYKTPEIQSSAKV